MFGLQAADKGISKSVLFIAMAVVIIIGASLYYVAFFSPSQSLTSSSSSSSTNSNIQGIIAGFVTVGPSKPSCNTNQSSSCIVYLSGYSLLLTAKCYSGTASTTISCKTFSAQIAPSGHYSVLLDPGTYSITGLSPSCKWVGCSSTFPQQVVVQPGQQLIVNVNVDTGIR